MQEVVNIHQVNDHADQFARDPESEVLGDNSDVKTQTPPLQQRPMPHAVIVLQQVVIVVG